MIRREAFSSRRLVVFENILSVVTQAYYKRSHEIENTVKELKLELDDGDLSEISKTQGRRLTRGKRRRIRLSLVAGTGRKVTIVDDDNKDDLFGEEHILDYLISPLKLDYPYGSLIRDMEY